MTEPKEYIYSLKELAITLIKENDIHDGYWATAIEFKLGATIASISDELPLPSGMVSVSRIGLRLSEQSFPQAVNAAEVNPSSLKSDTRVVGAKSTKK